MVALVSACGGKAQTKVDETPVVAVSPFFPSSIQDMAKSLADAVKASGKTPPVGGTPILVVAAANSEFWVAPGIGVARAGSELGVPASYQEAVAPSGGGTIDGQEALLKQALASGSLYKGIALSVIGGADASANPNAISTIMQNEATTPVSAPAVPFVTIDSDVPSAFTSARMVYLGTDNYNAGVQAGKQILKMLPDGGTIDIASSLSTSSITHIGRVQGITDALAGSNVTIANVVASTNAKSNGTNCLSPAKADPAQSCITTDVEAAIAADHPALIAAINTSGSQHAAEALVAAGQVGTVKMLVFDAVSFNLTNLTNGTVQAIVAQHAYWEGYLAVHILYANAMIGTQATLALLAPLLYNSDKFGPNLIDTGTDIVTTDNLTDYQAYLQSINIQSD